MYSPEFKMTDLQYAENKSRAAESYIEGYSSAV